MQRKLLPILLLLGIATSASPLLAQSFDTIPIPGRWTVEKANAWYDEHPWLVGANYIPRNAINQLEMWQAETWDPETIAEEMTWAAEMGMNTMRVYLHDLAWRDDKAGLYGRMDEFMDICKERGITPSFVFFDDCHEPTVKSGPQSLPVPGFHNSGWVTSPGRPVVRRYAAGTSPDSEVERLKAYVQETMEQYRDDDRVLLWELYNEPGCDYFKDTTNQLLYDSWKWAREVAPSQPITSTSLGSLGDMNEPISRVNSDVHSIHLYSDNRTIAKCVTDYRRDGRPVMATEWLARTHGGTVFDNLPLLKALNVAAINWGFVSGKSGTVWPWSSRDRDGVRMWPNQLRAEGKVMEDWQSMPEPDVWHHDLLRRDGTPFDPAEVELFKLLTGVKSK